MGSNDSLMSAIAGGVVENIRFGDKGTSYATVTSGKIEGMPCSIWF